VLKQEGWEILDVTEAYFKDLTYHQRLNFIQGWIKEAKERQIVKGIVPAVPPKYV
jgi:hypothetical protein